MSQQAAVTLNTHVYNPAGMQDGSAIWMNREAGVAAGFSKLSESYKDPVTGTQTKITYNLAIPVVATTDTDCSCAGTLLRTSSVQVSFWVASGSTLAERTDLYLRLKDLIASAVVSNAVENLDPSFG